MERHPSRIFSLHEIYSVERCEFCYEWEMHPLSEEQALFSVLQGIGV